LPVSNPMLKATMVSALEAIIRYTAFKSCFHIQLAPLHRGAAAVRGVADAPGDARGGGGRHLGWPRRAG
jgi:hypothetical protein